MAIAHALSVICRERYLSGEHQAEYIVPVVLKHLNINEPEPEAHEGWLACLQAMAPNLDGKVLASKFSELIQTKSDHCQGVPARVTGCRVLGAIAGHLSVRPRGVPLLPSVPRICRPRPNTTSGCHC